jgi:membrane dipeptidase
MPVRLIDLHCNWLRQYAPETRTFDPAANTEIPARLSQLSGYMTATSAAVLACARSAADWEHQPDPWQSLGELIARYEAEFSGRLLIDPADVTRWRSEPPDALTWGMLSVSGLDYLVRTKADLKRLPDLFKRGVRVIQLVATAHSALAGSADPDDDRSLTDLGRACLSEITALASIDPVEAIPILDLAHLNTRSMAEVMESLGDALRNRRVLLMYSHGSVAHPEFDGPRAIGLENLARLRTHGGLIGLTPGPPFHQSADELKSAIDHVATIPFEGRVGYEGLAIGCDFLDRDAALPELRDASAIIDWVSKTFDQPTAELVLEANARQFLANAVGGNPPAIPA